MALAEKGNVRFAKSPLQLVVSQVRLPVLPRYAEGGFVSGFIEALQGEYPGVAREQQLGIQISPAGITTGAPDFLWRLTDRHGQWAVVLGESSLALEARKYTSYGEFADRFKAVLGTAVKHLGITERTRLGLRYVNEIRYPEADTLDDWRNLLRPEFLGFAAAGVISGRVEHTFQEVQFQRNDGVFVVRHGLLTGSVVAPLPSQQTHMGRFYLIDLDYFDATQQSLSIPETMSAIKAYNGVMSRFFRSTLTENLQRYLEPINDRSR